MKQAGLSCLQSLWEMDNSLIYEYGSCSWSSAVLSHVTHFDLQQP